jgi:hypothetical protein
MNWKILEIIMQQDILADLERQERNMFGVPWCIEIREEFESKVAFFERTCTNTDCGKIQHRILDIGIYALPLDKYCSCGWWSLKTRLIEI